MDEKLYEKLEARWEKLGFESLEREEQETIALFWLESEVMNGGLHQYFLNSSGDMFPFALSGLRRIGAKKSLHALESAAEKLGSIYPENRDDRIDILEQLGENVDPFKVETGVLQELQERLFDISLASLAVKFEDIYT